MLRMARVLCSISSRFRTRKGILDIVMNSTFSMRPVNACLTFTS